MQQMFLNREVTTLQSEDYAFVSCVDCSFCEFGFFRQTGPEIYTCLSFHPEFYIESRYEIPFHLISVFFRTISAVTGLKHIRLEGLSSVEFVLFPFCSSKTIYYRFFD